MNASALPQPIRGDVIVVVQQTAASALENLREHTPADIVMLTVPATGDTGDRPTAGPAEVGDPEVHRIAELDHEALAPADLVLVSGPCRVGVGWLEGLRAAAYSSAEIASASALGLPSPGPMRASQADRPTAIPAHRPRMEHPAEPLVYVRRSAIELAGAPGPGFAQRCLEAGLAHVLADDVLIAVDEAGLDIAPVLQRAREAARRALAGPQVVVDARNLAGPMDGTRVHVLELLGALARSAPTQVTALVPERLDPDTAAALDRAPGLRRVPVAPGGPLPPGLRADVVHRPFQIASDADLRALGAIAERLVITQQDLIGYHNPAYFPGADAWRGYRAMTARALRAADRVLFFSEHVRAEAVAEELVEPHRAEVVRIGVDHVLTGGPPAPARPVAAATLPDDVAMILCLGADYRHKNRVFALRIVQTLQREHGWLGHLVLAGPAVRHGSSRAAERALLDADPRLGSAVLELGEVSEAEKQWLLGRSALVLYPTVHEGFGLIPFEAAAHGRPCLWAPGTALSELFGDQAAGLVAWDAAAGAAAALALMGDPDRAAANRATVAAAAQALRWDATAGQLRDVYRTVCEQPAAPAARLERTRGAMQEGLSADAIRLVGPGGALPSELERPLLALATHKRIGAPVFAAIRAGYRLSRRWSDRAAE